MAAKKTHQKARSAPNQPQVFTEPTLTHLHYHPEAALVRAHIEQDIEILGKHERHGRDVDIALADLDADIQGALSDAFRWIAEDVKATPYEAATGLED
jgi:hypothetical protein